MRGLNERVSGENGSEIIDITQSQNSCWTHELPKSAYQGNIFFIEPDAFPRDFIRNRYAINGQNALHLYQEHYPTFSTTTFNPNDKRHQTQVYDFLKTQLSLLPQEDNRPFQCLPQSVYYVVNQFVLTALLHNPDLGMGGASFLKCRANDNPSVADDGVTATFIPGSPLRLEITARFKHFLSPEFTIPLDAEVSYTLEFDPNLNAEIISTGSGTTDTQFHFKKEGEGYPPNELVRLIQLRGAYRLLPTMKISGPDKDIIKEALLHQTFSESTAQRLLARQRPTLHDAFGETGSMRPASGTSFLGLSPALFKKSKIKTNAVGSIHDRLALCTSSNHVLALFEEYQQEKERDPNIQWMMKNFRRYGPSLYRVESQGHSYPTSQSDALLLKEMQEQFLIFRKIDRPDAPLTPREEALLGFNIKENFIKKHARSLTATLAVSLVVGAVVGGVTAGIGAIPAFIATQLALPTVVASTPFIAAALGTLAATVTASLCAIGLALKNFIGPLFRTPAPRAASPAITSSQSASPTTEGAPTSPPTAFQETAPTPSANSTAAPLPPIHVSAPALPSDETASMDSPMLSPGVSSGSHSSLAGVPAPGSARSQEMGTPPSSAHISGADSDHSLPTSHSHARISSTPSRESRRSIEGSPLPGAHEASSSGEETPPVGGRKATARSNSAPESHARNTPARGGIAMSISPKKSGVPTPDSRRRRASSSSDSDAASCASAETPIFRAFAIPPRQKQSASSAPPTDPSACQTPACGPHRRAQGSTFSTASSVTVPNSDGRSVASSTTGPGSGISTAVWRRGVREENPPKGLSSRVS